MLVFDKEDDDDDSFCRWGDEGPINDGVVITDDDTHLWVVREMMVGNGARNVMYCGDKIGATRSVRDTEVNGRTSV